MPSQTFLSPNHSEGLDWLRASQNEVPRDVYRSWTQEPYLFVSEKKLNELIDERVGQKVNEVLEQRTSIIFRDVTKTQAKKETAIFIKEKQQEGIFQVSVLDIVLGLKLPPSQVEAVLEGYEKENKIKAI